MMSQMAGSMGLPGMGPMSKKQRGRQMQAQSKKGKKGKGKAKGGARPAGPWALPGLPPGAGFRRRRPARRDAGPAARPGPARSHEAELRPARGRAAGPVTRRPPPVRRGAARGRAPRPVGARRPVHVRAGPRRGDGQPRRLAAARAGRRALPRRHRVGRQSTSRTSPRLREQALTERAAGVLALRDCGSPVDTRALDDEPDLPRIIRAGRHIAAPRRYIPGLARRGGARRPGGRGAACRPAAATAG